MTHPRKIKKYSVLFVDLDGTLLDIEVDFFMGPMIHAMYGCFKDLLDEGPFRAALFHGIDEIMEWPRPKGQTNQEGFTRAFSDAAGVTPVEVAARFDRFYREVFPTLNGHGRPRKGAARFLTEASNKGYRLVLATNPLFPTIAVVERLKWADVDPGLFEFIPGLETMGSCKPQLHYFVELTSRLRVDPSDCLMAGNDVQQDMSAAKAGMDTFLVEGHVVDRGTGGPEPDGRGSLSDLAEMLGIS